MDFSLANTVQILERTPYALHALLHRIDDVWAHTNEGGETWSPYDVVGHLIHCDAYNWIPRIELILSNDEVQKFEPLDRFAQKEKSKGKTLDQLLDEFVQIRLESLEKLKALNPLHEQFSKTAIHPELGSVTLAELIATWAVHDLDHLAQIARVLAKNYKKEVGPWVTYLRVLNS